MPKRITRVNELLQREVSEQMRRYHRSDAVAVTISGVETSTDLRRAKVFYSVLGDAMTVEEAEALFDRIGPDLRRRVSQRVVLKYFPHFEFVYDPSLERGAHVLDLIDQLDEDND